MGNESELLPRGYKELAYKLLPEPWLHERFRLMIACTMSFLVMVSLIMCQTAFSPLQDILTLYSCTKLLQQRPGRVTKKQTWRPPDEKKRKRAHSEEYSLYQQRKRRHI
eukprot:scaffold131499_cov19-Tisochrysis_lutea.AAC.1